jgi:hypothetical protein
MKTNHNGHALRNLTNRVMAVIDDRRSTLAAVETLARAGIADGELATFEGEGGMRQIDADGVHSGAITHVLRSLQRWTAEGDHLRRYQSEIASGHRVVDVCVHGRRQRDTVVQILRAHGAHFINAYGQWTLENVAA